MLQLISFQLSALLAISSLKAQNENVRAVGFALAILGVMAAFKMGS